MRRPAGAVRAGCLLAALAAGPAAAQPVRGLPDLAAQLEAMKALAPMVGSWKGEGWIEAGGRRSEFQSSEVVESLLNGTVILVKGEHVAQLPGQLKPLPIHQAAGLIHYDETARLYRFSAHTMRGLHHVAEGRVENGAFVWSVPDPSGEGTTRYTMRATAGGTWHETGERSTDGATWTLFFEMTLTRVP